MQNNFNPVMLVFSGKLSDECPYARVSIIFKGFLHHFVLAEVATG